MPQRTPLTRERVVDAAARVADEGGLAGVSMRNVGRELGVEAMSLYHHVKDKAALLDGLADWIYTRIELPERATPWRPAMAARAASARRALAAHPWSLALVDTRRVPGPHVLRHNDAVLGFLRRDGFPLPLATHAFSAIDAYVYGFVVTELNLPFDPAGSVDAFVDHVSALVPAERYPYLAELVTAHAEDRGYSYAEEFEYGLDLILDSVEVRLREVGG
jgi:AcrR family transcriptional regulator